jgi:hypothetical protein
MEFLVDECDFLLLAWSKEFLVVLAFGGVLVGLGVVAPCGCTGFVVFPAFLSRRFTVVRRLFVCCGCEVDCGVFEWDRTEPNGFDFGGWR